MFDLEDSAMTLSDEMRRALLASFRDESNEVCAEMMCLLLDVAEGGIQVDPAIRSVRRNAHSLKGTAATLDLPRVAKLLHAFEDHLGTWSTEKAPESPVLDEALQIVMVVRDVIAAAAANGAEDSVGRALSAAERALPTILAKPRPPKVGQLLPSMPTPVEPASEAVRVSTQVLDDTLRRSQELVAIASFHRGRATLVRDTIERLQFARRAASRANDANARGLLDEALADALQVMGTLRQEGEHTWEIQERLSTAIRDDLRRLRLQPISILHEGLRLAVRDACRRIGCEAHLRLEGGDVQMDRRIIDAIRYPLLHLVRNAVAHGIERPEERVVRAKPRAGVVTMKAEARGSRVQITILDDGRGIDPAAIGARAVELGLRAASAPAPTFDEATELIFSAGFSTSVIGDVSGRGVGLDVVRQNVAAVTGTIAVKSERGRSTSFILDLPLTLASVRGLFVRASDQMLVVPSLSVECVVELSPEDVVTIGGRASIIVRGVRIPYRSLNDLLGNSRAPVNFALVLRVADRRVGVGVSSVETEDEVVISSPAPELAAQTVFAGAVVRPMGDIFLVVDPAVLVIGDDFAQPLLPVPPSQRRKRLLIVDDSVTTRSLERHMLAAAGYEVVAAQNGEDALAILAREEEPFSLVLADVQMPRMDGYELTKRLRASERFRRMPIILISSLGTAEERRRGLESGANAYVVKREYEGAALIEMIKKMT